MCRGRNVGYTQEGFDHLIDEWYVKSKRALKNCHPRDILDQLLDFAKYKHLEAVATPQMLDIAAASYFADL